MNNFELYDRVRELDNLNAIEDIEMACRFAKIAIFRKKIEDAIQEALDAGFMVTIDHENEDGVKEVTIPSDATLENWGVWFK